MDISFIIPVRNNEKYISYTLESILNHDFAFNSEIIVVDDGSSDKTKELAQNYADNVISTPPLGISHACNLGAKRSKGDFLLFLDSDDLLVAENFGKIYNMMKNSELMGVKSQAQDFMTADLDIGKKFTARNEPYYGLLNGCFLMRKELFQKIGFFDESMQAGQAVDWLLRCEKSGFDIPKVPVVTLKRRIHANNTSTLRKNVRFSDYAKSMRQLLSRKGKSDASEN